MTDSFDDITNYKKWKMITCFEPFHANFGQLLLSPIWFRERPESEAKHAIDAAEQDQEKTEQHPVLRCQECGHTITAQDQRIQYGGSHTHTFFNPAGIVYDLGCFASAPGCSAVGEDSSEFTWFAGCVWRVAICSSCGEHLGWQFQTAEKTFFGLILPRLVGGL